MAQRSRYEAKWTHPEATVQGKQTRNKWWVIVLGFAAIMLISTTAMVRYMNFQTVGYELLQCAAPLTEESSWAEVQAADCRPMPVDGVELIHLQEGSVREPVRVEGSTIFVEDVPINSPAHALRLTLSNPVSSIVVAEPENERLRTEMSGDAQGLRACDTCQKQEQNGQDQAVCSISALAAA